HAYRRTTCVVAAIYVLHRTPPQPTLFPYTTLFRSGRWALFTLSSEKNDGILTVVEAAGNTRHVIDRAESPVFSPDNRFVAFTIKPAKAVLEEERKKDTPASRMPPDTLGILDLRTGAVTRVARVRGFRMPEEAGGWIAYQLGRAPEEKTDSAANDSTRAAPGAVQPRRAEPGRMPEPPAGEPRSDSAKAAPERKRDEGYTLVLRNLESGDERRIEIGRASCRERGEHAWRGWTET